MASAKSSMKAMMDVVFMLYVCCGLTSSHAGPITQENSRLLDKLRVPSFVGRSDLFTRHFLIMSVAFSCRSGNRGLTFVGFGPTRGRGSRRPVEDSDSTWVIVSFQKSIIPVRI